MKPVLPVVLLLFTLATGNVAQATTYTLVVDKENPTASEVTNNSSTTATLGAGDVLNIPQALFSGSATRTIELQATVNVNTAEGENAAKISFAEAGWRQVNLNNLHSSGSLVLVGNSGTTYYSIYTLKGTSSVEGTLTLSNGNNGRIQLNLSGSDVAKGAVIDLNTSQNNTNATAVLNLETSATVAGLTGAKTAARVTALTGTTQTLTLDVAAGKDYSYSGQIGKGDYGVSTMTNGTSVATSGSIDLVKKGEGIQRLGGQLAIGSLSVLQGTLDVSGSTGLGSEALLLDLSGGTLQGFTLTDANKGNISFAAGQTGGVLKDLHVTFDATQDGWAAYALGNNVTIDGLDLTLTGNMMEGSESITLFTQGSLSQEGAFTLNYNGVTASATDDARAVTIGRKTYTLSEAGGSILVTQTGNHLDLVWQGTEGNMTWQVGGNNWSGEASDYQMGDNVTFGADGAGTVTISGQIGGGSVSFTGGTYTLTNADTSSGLVTGGSLTLSGDAHVTITNTQNLTGDAVLTGTSTLNINRETLGNLKSVSLEQGTRLEISSSNLTTQDATGVSKVTGSGTVALNLRSNTNDNYTRVTFDDAFTGVAEINGSLWAGSTMKNVDLKMMAGSTLLLKDTDASITVANNIEVAGNITLRATQIGKDLTLSGVITGGDYTITKDGSADLYITGDMSGFTGRVTVNAGKYIVGAGVKSSNSLTVKSGKTAQYGDSARITLAADGDLLADGGTILLGSDVQMTGGKLRCGTGGGYIEARSTAEGEAPGTVTYSNVRVTSGEKVAGSTAGSPGTITNGNITVTRGAAFSLENLHLVDSLVTLSGTGAVTLNDVMLGKGSSITRSDGNACTLNFTNSGITLTNDHVTNAADNHQTPLTLSYNVGGDANVSGSFTLAFDRELMLAVGAWSGEMKHVDLTLTGLASWSNDTAIDFDSYSQYFDPENVTVDTSNLATGGSVVVSFDLGRPIPEPTAAGLGLMGAVGLLLRRKRARKL